MLTDDVLLGVFDFYVKEFSNVLIYPKDMIEEWQTLVYLLVYVSTMAKRCFRITKSPEFTTLLYTGYTCEGHAGCLAILASRH
jgi:hypothetical protein